MALCRFVHTDATEHSEDVPADATAVGSTHTAEEEYIDGYGEGNVRSLYSSMSTPDVVRLKEGAAVLTTGRVEGIPAGIMGKVIGFRSAEDKAEDGTLSQHELPWGMSKQQALLDWDAIALDRRFPHYEFVVNGRKKQVLVTPIVDSVDDAMRVVRCTRHQLPLVLGYGLTVHRAQGLTLDAVTFDVRGLFACGQLYTAMSRVRGYQFLKLLGGVKEGMKLADPRVALFEAAAVWHTIDNGPGQVPGV